MGDPFLPEDVIAIVEQSLEAQDGNAYTTDTLEELAGLIGIDPAAMQASVDRYNELVEAGVDEDFHKQADFLFPVVEPPFYACKVGVALLAIVGGLKINNKLQVLDANRQPIEGLYATGNVSGDLYAVDYPINMAGNSNGRCVTWGYLLGQILAGVDDLRVEAPPHVKTEEELAAEQAAAEQAAADKAAQQEALADATFADGTYEATGRGIGGDVPVTVTIEGGVITSVEVGDNSETQGIGSNAIEQLPSKIVEANGTAGVEVVSGASVTSNAIFDAVNDCLTQASA